MDLANKRILISGATGGLGRAILDHVYQMGASITLVGRNHEKMKDATSGYDPSRIEIYRLELDESADIDPFVQEMKSGKVFFDGFVHAAGIELTQPMRRNTREDFLKFFRINSLFAFDLIGRFQAKRLWQKGGSIVIISSIMGLLGDRGKTVYCASKGGIESFVKAAALELAEGGVRINSVCPGLVNTPMLDNIFVDLPEDMRQNLIAGYPLGLGKPEDIANLCGFLLSDKARWITGTSVVIDGGFSCK